MSLNHICSSAYENTWMNIYCNDLKCQTFTSASGPTFNGPFHVVETSPSTITGSNSVEMLSLQNSNTASNTQSQLRIINPGGNNSLRLSSQNTTNLGLINADNALNISTTGASAISLQPNASTTATFAPTLTTIATPLSVPNQQYAEYHSTTPQSIPNSTLTTALFPTLVRNVGDITYNAGTGVLTIGTTGVYMVSYVATFASNVDSNLRLGQIGLSNSAVYGLEVTSNISNNAMSIAGSSSIYMTATTTVTISVQQLSGGALNLNTATIVISRIS